jgi:hypothetical protein
MKENPDFGQIPNGSGAAAILAAAMGSLALGLLSLAEDALPPVQRALIVWPPTGSLSGVTLAAIVVWLATWYWLGSRWNAVDVNMVRINLAAFAMLGAALLLTFPPFMDLLQGK